MGMKKTPVSVRIAQQQNDALETIADKHNAAKSEMVRAAIRRIIDDHENILDEYMVLANELEKEKSQAKPFQSVSHMPNNLYEFCLEQIDKPYPIPPEDVYQEYHQPYTRVIKVKHKDNEDRKNELLAKLDHALRMYEILHPQYDDNPELAKRACIHYAKGVMEQEGNDMDDARSWVQARVNDGVLPESQRDEVYDALRNKQREKWQTDWKEGVRANWGDS